MEKKWFAKDRISDEGFIKVCEESNSMAHAAAKLKMHFNTFKKRAIILDCYKPNQSGKGMRKKYGGKNITPLNEILEGKHPNYQTYKLKNRLLREGYMINRCEVCGIEDWYGNQLNMELDHIDGDRTNHKRENLRIICPNCHAQTDTYRAKNK